MKQGHSQFWIEVKNYLFILIGSAIVAIGFNTLLLPNQIAAGGVSGIVPLCSHSALKRRMCNGGLIFPCLSLAFIY
ncbi:hypothetical protein BsIDN1_61970 [Bacillus safensis]|uniref:Uncharacterized protein n=1 Tax=Bacillus safensis TaxID=561879 RepID=A0A5S9ML03_BACIA|nr:hypothetical protein BsIDN1_61970 [Bacillus safensis]